MQVDQAGPKMDAELAKAFGWEFYEAHFGIIARKLDGTTLHPHFSTTWEGMRLVVEEMQRRDYWIYIDQRRGDKYNVRWWHAATAEWTDFVLAGPLPYAVALAALRALREDKGDETR